MKHSFYFEPNFPEDWPPRSLYLTPLDLSKGLFDGKGLCQQTTHQIILFIYLITFLWFTHFIFNLLFHALNAVIYFIIFSFNDVLNHFKINKKKLLLIICLLQLCCRTVWWVNLCVNKYYYKKYKNRIRQNVYFPRKNPDRLRGIKRLYLFTLHN